MALTETATRMLGYLPVFYREDPIIIRIIQSWANEVDRMDARLDAITDGLVPALAGNELGMLGLWEFITGLPVNPPAASVAQRRAKVLARFQALSGNSAASYMQTITTAVGSTDWQLLRDTPGPFEDTLEIPFAAGEYNAAQIEAIARQMHPAHRQLHMRYSEGWIHDVSRVDGEEL